MSRRLSNNLGRIKPDVQAVRQCQANAKPRGWRYNLEASGQTKFRHQTEILRRESVYDSFIHF